MRLRKISQVGITSLFLGCYSSVVCAQELPFDKNITLQERERVAKAVGFAQIRADDQRAGSTTPTQLNVAKIDLNADNQADYIAVLDGSLTCGSAGCQTEVLLVKGSVLLRILPNVNAQSITLGSGSTGGMRDLLLSRVSTWIWDGRRYVRK